MVLGEVSHHPILTKLGKKGKKKTLTKSKKEKKIMRMLLFCCIPVEHSLEMSLVILLLLLQEVMESLQLYVKRGLMMRVLGFLKELVKWVQGKE